MEKILFCLSLVLALLELSVGENFECVPRDYGNGGTVCVCNSTYCDTIEPVTNFPPRQYYIYTSNKEGQRFALSHKNFGPKLKTKGTVLTINTSITYQTIHGFGAAFTDAACMNIHNLSEEAGNKLLESYFSPNGIEYNIGRVPIAGSDFSVRPYTYDDHAHDDALKNLELPAEDTKFKIPDIQKAIGMSTKKMRLMAAAWTAPPWMKTNNDYTGFGFLKEEHLKTWSDYHIRFLEEYDKHGLQFWALSTGNEPLNGAIPFFSFNCMGWTPSSQAKWVTDYFGPALRRSKFNNTILIALDDQRFLLPWWLSPLLGKNESSNYISGIGVHWYYDNIVPPLLLDKTHDAYPDKFIIATEACFVPKLWEKKVVLLGSWSRGEQYAESIIEDINHWVTGWLDWNLALDLNGGPNWAKNFVDASVIVNQTSDEFYKQPMFYAMGHFSKFVPEGSVRVGLQGTTRDIKAVAFRTPDEHTVLVILNKKNRDIPIGLDGAPRGFANFVVSAKSITTIIYKDKKPPFYKLFT